MSPEISGLSFDEEIEYGLLQHGPDARDETSVVRETPPAYGGPPPGGYRRLEPQDDGRTLRLLPHDVVDFVLATQPKN